MEILKMPECSRCGSGPTELVRMDHDIGPLLGLVRVDVKEMPVMRCAACNAVSIFGPHLEWVAMWIAGEMITHAELDPMDVRFLRKRLGYTQDDLARHLGVERVTVNRWENSSQPLTGAQAYALRSHVFVRLREQAPDSFKDAEQALAAEPVPFDRKDYQVDGRRLHAAAG